MEKNRFITQMDTEKLDPKRIEQQFTDGIRSLVPSGYFGKNSDLILVIEDLISNEEAEILIDAAKNLDIWESNTKYKNKYTIEESLKSESPLAYQTLYEVTNRFKDKIANFFDAEIKTFNRPISKWDIGGSQKPHADKEWADGTPAEPNYNDIGSVIYLNDDYTGGELYFTQHDIKIKPKYRSGIAFPGDMYFLHGVTPVQETARYTIPIFWTVTKYEPNKDKTKI